MFVADMANQPHKYEKFMNVIFSLNTEVYVWLMGGSVRPEQWALCKDGEYCWGHISTNMTECFNNLLKGARLLPMTTCIQFTFNQIVDLFVKNHKVAWDQVYALP